MSFVLVDHVEVGVEVDDEVLLDKCLASVGHVVGIECAALQVFKLLSAVEEEQQVHLVSGGYHLG